MANKKKPLWDVSINSWYSTQDHRDLYKVVFRSAGRYAVISYSRGHDMRTGSMNDCKRFITSSCEDHISFMQRMANRYAE